MRLAQLSQTGDFERGTAALARMLEDPFIAFLDGASAFEQDATDFDYRPVSATGTIQGRDIGGEYTPSTEEPNDKQTGALAMMGDALHIDISHIEDDRRGLRDLGGWIDKKLNKKFVGWRTGLSVRFFNGSGAGTPRQMKGWKTIYNGTDNLPGFGITGVLDAAGYASGAPDSLDLSDPANWNLFVEIMEFALSQVDDPQGIAMNKELYARARTIAREKNLLGTTRNHLDQPLLTWGETPMIRLRDGCITNTEPDNAETPATNTTSLYIMSPAEGRMCVATNSGLWWYEDMPLESKQSGQIRWEFRGENRVEEENAARRLRNLLV